MTTMSPEQAARRARLVYIMIPLVLMAILVIILTRDDDSGPSRPPEARSAASYADEYGGGIGRYEAVLGLSDCAALGRMFSDGKSNFDNNAPGGRDQWLGQMEVTADRMDALGCP